MKRYVQGKSGKIIIAAGTVVVIAVSVTGIVQAIVDRDGTSAARNEEVTASVAAPQTDKGTQVSATTDAPASQAPPASQPQQDTATTQPSQSAAQAKPSATQPATSTQNPYGQTSIAPANQVVDGLTSDQWSKTPPPDCRGFVNTDPGSTRYSKLPLTLSAYDVTLKGMTPVALTASSPHGLVIDNVWSNNECGVPVGVWYDGAIVSGLTQQVMISASNTATPGDYVLTVQAQAHLIRYVANVTIHYTN